MNLFKSSREKWKNLNSYQKAITFSSTLSFITIVSIFAFGDGELITSSIWYLNLLPIISVVGSEVSGPSYIAKFIDSKKNDCEKKFTLTGLLLGLSFGLGLAILMPSTKVMEPILTFLSTFGLFSGFCSRLGTTLSKDNKRPKFEKWIISIFAIGSIAFSAFLIKIGAMALLSVVGFTSALSGGLALPIWIGAFYFACSFSGAYVQTAEYFAKSISLFYKPNHEYVQKRKNEYQGSFFGLSLGTVIATIAIAALFVAQPHIVAGTFLLIVLGTLIAATCMGTTASLFSKIAKCLDNSSATETPSSASTSTGLVANEFRKKLISRLSIPPKQPLSQIMNSPSDIEITNSSQSFTITETSSPVSSNDTGTISPQIKVNPGNTETSFSRKRAQSDSSPSRFFQPPKNSRLLGRSTSSPCLKIG